MTPGGYAWWYVDAISDDCREALTLIAFVGSVFSPYYAAARRRGATDPEHYCALNVAVYGPRGRHWSMTERGRLAIERETARFVVGPSRIEWRPGRLSLEIDELAAPWPRRIRGRVGLSAATLFTHPVALDAAGRHRWQALAPCARVDVDLEAPHRCWQGHGYFDMNTGDRPLEDDFASWHWSRATLQDGSTAVLYDVRSRAGDCTSLGLRFDPRGGVDVFDAPVAVALRGTGWGIERGTRADTAGGARVLRTLEDAPFYARSVLATRLLGEDVAAVHESLSLERFRSRWVQALLPFRMPRRPGSG